MREDVENEKHRFMCVWCWDLHELPPFYDIAIFNSRLRFSTLPTFLSFVDTIIWPSGYIPNCLTPSKDLLPQDVRIRHISSRNYDLRLCLNFIVTCEFISTACFYG